MTNKPESYHIILTYANSFNSTEHELPVEDANVYVTDNMENQFIFHKRESGNYASDSLQFTGIPGRTYRLHIITSDNNEYESDPQRLFPEASPDSVYAEFGNQEILERSTGLKVNTHGANVFLDIRNQSDSLPRYRFTSNLVIQYSYIIWIVKNWNDPAIHFDFYCWQTVDANPNIDLTGVNYSLNSASIRKQQVCFLVYDFDVYAMKYGLEVNWADTTGTPTVTGFQYYTIHHRILYLNQYTLNNETYLYYKSLNDQLQSEDKLFDPIATQLTGNIKCISDPEKRAIGFFEASSVNNSAYIVDLRNLTNFQPSLKKTPYILPPEHTGCRINRLGSRIYNVPSFWIFFP